MEKLKVLLILMMGLCLSIPCFADRRNIELAGTWKLKEKSYNPDMPIQIWLEDNEKEITIGFHKNLGPVEICITSSDGNVIYVATIDAAGMSTHVISLDNNLEKKEYQIVISDKLNMVKGKFVKY